MLAIAEAMSANKRWPNLAQYSILKETLADLRTIASGQDLEGAESSAVLVEQFETFEELEEELEKHVDEASEIKEEKVAESGGGVHPTPVADQPNVGEESQVGKLPCHLDGSSTQSSSSGGGGRAGRSSGCGAAPPRLQVGEDKMCPLIALFQL